MISLINSSVFSFRIESSIKASSLRICCKLKPKESNADSISLPISPMCNSFWSIWLSNLWTSSFSSTIKRWADFFPMPGTLVSNTSSPELTAFIKVGMLSVERIDIAILGPIPLTLFSITKSSLSASVAKPNIRTSSLLICK